MLLSAWSRADKRASLWALQAFSLLRIHIVNKNIHNGVVRLLARRTGLPSLVADGDLLGISRRLTIRTTSVRVFDVNGHGQTQRAAVRTWSPLVGCGNLGS